MLVQRQETCGYESKAFIIDLIRILCQHKLIIKFNNNNNIPISSVENEGLQTGGMPKDQALSFHVPLPSLLCVERKITTIHRSGIIGARYHSHHLLHFRHTSILIGVAYPNKI